MIVFNHHWGIEAVFNHHWGIEAVFNHHWGIEANYDLTAFNLYLK